MTDEKLIQSALAEGFSKAAIIKTENIVFNPSFRPYCEENICGQYGINYTCPPDCGTPEEMKQKILKHKKALVLKTDWCISSFNNKASIKAAKGAHNAATVKLMNKLKGNGINGFIVGSSGCDLCEKCAITENKPCLHPDIAYSCMSAYCIYVKKLAEDCGMDYNFKDGILPFFGMYVFD